jgi:purine-binding chemotaxis protein CheW
MVMAETRQYLTFGIDRECFAVPVERVREILDMRPMTRLPHAPPYVVGLTDVRGVGLLVIDLRLKFRLPPAEATNRTRIILVDVDIDGQRQGFGLVADCVFAVSSLDGAPLGPSPSIGSGWRADYVVGVGQEGGQFVVVLDLDRLIGTDELPGTTESALLASRPTEGGRSASSGAGP